MHCSVIRMPLYHYEDSEGKLQVNAQLKNVLKSRGFKWKTVTNDTRTGSRVEILECPNVKAYKEQSNPLKCTVYRKGLRREDVHKEPFSFRISTMLAVGGAPVSVDGGLKNSSGVETVCGVLNGVMQYKRGFENNSGVNVYE